jgi:hypothetical protein
MITVEDKVVRYTPQEYPHQQGLTCGEFNLMGILAAFNLDYHKPERVRLRIWLLGYSFIQDIADRLEAHGLSAPVRHANHLSDDNKLDLLKSQLDQDQPVLMAIGNGHLNRGRYVPLARFFLGHFITLYGYSDRERRFYIYDPYLEGDYPDEIPVGNEIRSYDQLLRDWRGPFYYRFIGMDHVYIAASVWQANAGDGIVDP